MKNTEPITKNGKDVMLNHIAELGSNIGTSRKAIPKEKKPTSIEAQKASMSVSIIVFIISILKQVLA